MDKAVERMLAVLAERRNDDTPLAVTAQQVLDEHMGTLDADTIAGLITTGRGAAHDYRARGATTVGDATGLFTLPSPDADDSQLLLLGFLFFTDDFPAGDSLDGKKLPSLRIERLRALDITPDQISAALDGFQLVHTDELVPKADLLRSIEDADSLLSRLIPDDAERLLVESMCTMKGLLRSRLFSQQTAQNGISGDLPEPLMSPVEVAAYLGVPVATLHTWQHKGTGPKSYKVGKLRRYRPSDIEAWLDANSSPGAGA